VILLRTGFPPRGKLDEIFCLFPNTRDERNRILAAHKCWSISNLNLAINRALADSPEHSSYGGNTRFALAYGSHVVSFGAVQGTLYLVWAQTITYYNADKTVVKKLRDTPLLVNMNGEAIVTAMYILEPSAAKVATAPLPMVQTDEVRTPVLLGDHASLWVYEKRPSFTHGRLRTMGYNDAVNFASRPSRNTQEWITADTTTAGVSASASAVDAAYDAPNHIGGPYDWRATPEGLFATEPQALTIRYAGVTVSVAHSDGPEARDPFQEY
jgi:hypothetical protein